MKVYIVTVTSQIPIVIADNETTNEIKVTARSVNSIKDTVGPDCTVTDISEITLSNMVPYRDWLDAIPYGSKVFGKSNKRISEYLIMAELDRQQRKLNGGF